MVQGRLIGLISEGSATLYQSDITPAATSHALVSFWPIVHQTIFLTDCEWNGRVGRPKTGAHDFVRIISDTDVVMSRSVCNMTNATT